MLLKRLVSLLIVVMFVFSLTALTAPTARGEEKLSGVIAYQLKQIGPRLDKAEKLLDQGDKPNAQAAYDTAKQTWDAIHKDYKGQFDPKHSEIVAVQKRFDSIAARLKGGTPPTPPTPQPAPDDASGGAPPATMAYAMKQIQGNLDKAEQLLARGDTANAAANLGSATTQWDVVQKDFDGKFDPKHADVVALQKRLDAVRTRLGAAAEKPKPTPEPDAPGVAGEAPPAAMAYVMKQIDGNLDAAERAHEQMELESAKASFTDAERYWQSLQKDYRGNYDAAHPSVVALNEKYLRVKAKIEGLGAQADQAAADLPVVVAAISDIQKRLDAANDLARSSARGVSSLMSDYDSGREQNVDKLRLKVEELRQRSEEVNALLPDAHAAAVAFRKQYPDFQKLQKLVEDGRQAARSVERLEEFPAYWLEEGSRLINEAIAMAEGNIKQFSLARFKDLEGKDQAIQANAADGADFYVVELSTFLLDVIPSILPELPEAARAQLPEFAAARAEFQKRAAPLRADIQSIGGAVGKIRKEIVDAERRKLERARFPESEFTGGKWDTAEKEIAAAWEDAITDKELLEVSIHLPWDERTEARWRNDRWVVGTYRYISAHCLAKLANGRFRVYRMTYRNTKQADGDWGPLRHWSVGHSYEILEKYTK